MWNVIKLFHLVKTASRLWTFWLTQHYILSSFHDCPSHLSSYWENTDRVILTIALVQMVQSPVSSSFIGINSFLRKDSQWTVGRINCISWVGGCLHLFHQDFYPGGFECEKFKKFKFHPNRGLNVIGCVTIESVLLTTRQVGGKIPAYISACSRPTRHLSADHQTGDSVCLDLCPAHHREWQGHVKSLTKLRLKVHAYDVPATSKAKVHHTIDGNHLKEIASKKEANYNPTGRKITTIPQEGS